MKNIGSIIEESFGYYSFDFSGEPFDGEIINLNPDECRVFFNMEGKGDEYKFRERLTKMDEWFQTKPYKVQEDWAKHVAKWLREK